jgi:hypothetical protein
MQPGSQALLAFSVFVILFWAVLLCVGVLGGRAAKARAFVAKAAALAEQRDFEQARKLVLAAVRMRPALRSDSDIKTLYEIIVSRDTGNDARNEIGRIQTALPQLPKTRLETVFISRGFRLLLLLIGVWWLLTRLFDFYQSSD